jgi:hypothetical protein
MSPEQLMPLFTLLLNTGGGNIAVYKKHVVIVQIKGCGEK